MYDYRRMSKAEQQEIVDLRVERGYPWHKPPHPAQGEGWYFITAATYEHRHHFAAPRELTALTRRLLEAFADTNLTCAGWTVLSNHYHALVHAPSPQTIGRAIGPVHGRSSHYANRRDNTLGRQVWFKFSDRKVRSEGHYWACLHYIIWNPVKHGHVEQMSDWPWACYHDLLQQHGSEWIDDLMRSYPLHDFGDKWDIM
jgi:putative transposase